MVVAPGNTVVVLVVEDDRHTRELFRTTLRAEGFNVVAVEDGIEALTYLDTHTPSAVVLDLGLPRLHGRDVLAEMGAQGLTRMVPVIVVTGESKLTPKRTRLRVCLAEAGWSRGIDRIGAWMHRESPLSPSGKRRVTAQRLRSIDTGLLH